MQRQSSEGYSNVASNMQNVNYCMYSVIVYNLKLFLNWTNRLTRAYILDYVLFRYDI